MFSSVRIVLLVSSFAVLALCFLATADEDSRVLHGDRITLSVPVSLTEAAAEAFLDDRELALEYVESVLGCSTADTPLDVEVSFSLFGGTCGALTSYNLILFPLSFARQDRFNATGSVSHTELGCHEETHIVAALCWGRAALAMSEGLASYMDAAYRGGAIHHEVALGLQAAGDFRSLETLLRTRSATRTSINDGLMIYKGGASFVAFILDTHGVEALQEFYGLSWQPTVLLEGEAQRIFGRSLAELDSEWKEYLEREAKATPYAAGLYLEAWDRHYARLGGLQAQLGDLASASEPAVLGRSEVCESVNTRLNAQTEEILFAATDQEADAAYETYLIALEDSRCLLAEWLAAAEAFRQALDGENPEESLRLLDRAETGYATVGDHAMVEAVHTAKDELLATAQP